MRPSIRGLREGRKGSRTEPGTLHEGTQGLASRASTLSMVSHPAPRSCSLLIDVNELVASEHRAKETGPHFPRQLAAGHAGGLELLPRQAEVLMGASSLLACRRPRKRQLKSQF